MQDVGFRETRADHLTGPDSLETRPYIRSVSRSEVS